MFQTGLVPGAKRPILLNFAHRNQLVFSTDWTVEDAELMAYALLKKVEQAATYKAKALPPPPPILPATRNDYTGPTEE